MELEVFRTKHPNFTSGKLYINGVLFCNTLEDIDRGLTSDMPLDVIKHLKVFAQTAIPIGRYEVAMSFSNNFKKLMPILLNVKGFDGVRIHSGNKPQDTEGCLLVGKGDSTDGVLEESRVVIEPLYEKITTALKTEKVFISYKY